MMTESKKRQEDPHNVEQKLEEYGQALRAEDVPVDMIMNRFWQEVAIENAKPTLWQKLHRWLFPAALGMAFAGILLVLGLQQGWFQQQTHLGSDILTFKGGKLPIIMYHAHRSHNESKPIQTRDGQILYPGDEVQFEYLYNEPLYVMVVNIEESGHISKWYPLEEQQSKLLQLKVLFPDHTLELDHSQGQERLLFFASRQSFSFSFIQTHLRKIQAQKRNNLSQKQLMVLKKSMKDLGIATQSLLIKKQNRP